MNKGSKWYSILNSKCPQCHEGDFFVNKNHWSLRNFSEMYATCSHCNLSFKQEPGYYFGAMYVSYAINVAVMVAVWVVYVLFGSNDLSIWWMVLISVIAGLSLVPLTFRLSRLIWINMFIKFSSDAIKNRK